MEVGYKRRLVEYIKKNLLKRYTVESLKWALINQGYSRTDVTEAIEISNRELAEKAPMIKEKPKIKYEIFDKDNKPINIKKPFWKRFFNKT